MVPGNNPFEDALLAATVPPSLQELSSQSPALMNGQIDWNETPEAHVFKSDVTGLREEEVKVEIGDGRVLQISGERNVGREEINNDEAAAVQRVECSSGKFTRSFTLPTNAKMDQVRAAVENGVLIVTVPKDEAKQAVESSN